MAAQNKTIATIFKESGDFLLISGIGGIVLLMILPLPPFLLDVLLVASISFSILILLVAFYAYKPMDFSVFPTMLLLATLARLALNIASTRLILLHGSEGEGAAGQVIHAFGYFVVGGNYVVGFIVFAILVIINFVVITKGAGRIAEVSARFTLDAMPGKQLAIDADLNAGIINDKEALRRREEIAREADFYGSMDGASKFVRGDAIAGILITCVNVFGGLVIGVAQQGLPLIEALKIYTTLSVGDGIVSQVPALIISIASGLIVTKVSNNRKISEEIGMQTLTKWRPLAMASLTLMCMALIPGFPGVPFLLLAAIFAGGGYFVWKSKDKKTEAEKTAEIGAAGKMGELAAPSAAAKDDAVPALDLMEVEVGYDLISIVDQKAGGELPLRIVGIRKQLAADLGIVLPPVHIRDNLKLKPGSYRILLKGAVVGENELLPKHHLALDPGNVTRKVAGVPTVDPTFGLPALWIPDEQKEGAMIAGYTVVDLPSVMATHVTEIVRRHLKDLFGRQELASLLDRVKTTHPRVVSDLIPELMPFGTVLKVLQNLLHEKVSIRDLVTILESLAEHATSVKDPAELTEHARVALGRSIAQQNASAPDTLYALTLDRNLEEKLFRALSPSQDGNAIALDPNTAKALIEKLADETKKSIAENRPPVVLTSQQIRPHLYRLIERFIPNLPVLSHSEVAGHISVKPVGLIDISSVTSAKGAEKAGGEFAPRYEAFRPGEMPA